MTLPIFDLSEASPWPPALQHTPEVATGIQAATELAFGPYWDTPMAELDPETLVEQMMRYTPGLVEDLLAMGSLS